MVINWDKTSTGMFPQTNCSCYSLCGPEPIPEKRPLNLGFSDQTCLPVKQSSLIHLLEKYLMAEGSDSTKIFYATTSEITRSRAHLSHPFGRRQSGKLQSRLSDVGQTGLLILIAKNGVEALDHLATTSPRPHPHGLPNASYGRHCRDCCDSSR